MVVYGCPRIEQARSNDAQAGVRLAAAETDS
jgi:hypothetical protein